MDRQFHLFNLLDELKDGLREAFVAETGNATAESSGANQLTTSATGEIGNAYQQPLSLGDTAVSPAGPGFSRTLVFPATPSATAAREALQRFLPYDTSGRGRTVGRPTRGRGSPQRSPQVVMGPQVVTRPQLVTRPQVVTRPGSSRQYVSQPWRQQFTCLGYKEEVLTPTVDRLTKLNEAGLGDTVIEIDKNGSADALRAEIRRMLPKLESIEFEILKAVGRSTIQRQLLPVIAADPVPAVGQLRTNNRGTIYYIRPYTTLCPPASESNCNTDEDLQHEMMDESTNDTTEISTSTANSASNADIRERSVSRQASADLGTNTTPRSTAIDSWTARPSTSAAVTDLSPYYYEMDGGEFTDSTFEVQEIEIRNEMGSMVEFQSMIHAANPGQQRITVPREGMLFEFLGIIKGGRFNHLMEPQVRIDPEPAIGDGVNKEFFWGLLKGMREEFFDGRVQLFEGEPDHLIPSDDIILVEDRTFVSVGKVMAYVGTHFGYCFLGLSEAVKSYITAEPGTAIDACLEDIPDLVLRESISKMQSWSRGATMTEEEIRSLKDFALEYTTVLLTAESAAYIAQLIINYDVIKKRKEQLDHIKQAFTASPLLDYMRAHPYLIDAIFPSNSAISYSPELVISKIRTTGDGDDLIVAFLEAVHSIGNDGKLTDLVCAWTGSGILPDELKLTISDEERRFSVRTCFNEIVIPKAMVVDGPNGLKSYIRHVMTAGVMGFGQI